MSGRGWAPGNNQNQYHTARRGVNNARGLQGEPDAGRTVAVIQKAFRAFLSDKLDVDADQIVFDDERFRAPGSNLSPTFLEVADMARAAGREDLMQHSAYAVLDSRSFPNGAHICEVEIDPDTGAVEVARYSVVDDFGNLLNPMLVEGQVHGGVAQGIGQAISTL